ncbi:MAG: DUF3793 family protein [Ruminococcus sp.]|nr:DUF3793 family protein [Ruminococcus sp.]
MSVNESRSFEMALAYHAAPTIMGEKCGSLLSLSDEEFDIPGDTEQLLGQMREHGLRIRIIPGKKGRSLVYIYSLELLEKRLNCKTVRSFLAGYGYSEKACTEQLLSRLCKRLGADSFPHEIGIFLDYPLEDVEGFIRNCGQDCKYCGMWKVYGDVESAKRKFERYRCCRTELCGQLEKGKRLCACVA